VSIITISTDVYSNGRELAESVARKMGCGYVGDEIIDSASEMFEIPREKLIQALKSGVSIFDRFSGNKFKYFACLEAVLAQQMLNPNLVYQGFIGLPWFQKVSHVLKVRIIANLEDRISVAIQTHKLQGKVEAQDRIYKEDEELKGWGKSILGFDIADSSRYDLVINLGQMGADDTEDAIETILNTAQHKKFQPMTYSLNCMKDIALSLQVKASFSDLDPKMEIRSERGTVFLFSKTFKRKKKDLVLSFRSDVMKVEGVKNIEIYSNKEVFDNKARGY
jgi:cytidylate kinase